MEFGLVFRVHDFFIAGQIFNLSSFQLDFYYLWGDVLHFSGSGKNVYIFGQIYGIWSDSSGWDINFFVSADIFSRVWPNFLMTNSVYIMIGDISTLREPFFFLKQVCLCPARPAYFESSPPGDLPMAIPDAKN